MSRFVKKVGKVEYYEIDGIRASGIIPYYIKNNEVKILINLEFRNTKLVHNIIGGKVDKVDQKIEDTALYVVDWESESDSESGGFNNPQ